RSGCRQQHCGEERLLVFVRERADRAGAGQRQSISQGESGKGRKDRSGPAQNARVALYRPREWGRITRGGGRFCANSGGRRGQEVIANTAKRPFHRPSDSPMLKKPYKIGLFLHFSLYIPFPILVS